jgi:hypothetical protein
MSTATGAGTLAALVLVLVFGSPGYADWARGNTKANTAGGWFLQSLAWPAWRFDSRQSLQDLVAADLKAILVVALTALFLSLLPVATVGRARGTLSQFFAGWASYVFGGASAALLAALIQSHPSLLGALQAAGAGAGYGLFAGWIIGLATMTGRAGAG